MYASLAAVYDEIQGTDFSAWADYVCLLEKRYSHRTGHGDGRDGRPILLDLGCGTGGFCFEMASRGYDPIGIDASPAMLSVARDRQAAISGAEDLSACLFLQQDISRFELYGTVDIIVCLMDTLNHLVRKDQVRRLMKRCSNYLNPGGMMVFDLAGWNHMSRTLGNNRFFSDQPAFTLIWRNHFSRSRQVSTAEITLFTAGPDGRYQRSDECIRERYYDRTDIAELIRESNLELVAHHGDKTMTGPRAAEERSFFVLRGRV